MKTPEKQRPYKFLVIDDHADFRKLIAHHLTSEWPDAAVAEHDPQQKGRLPGHFSGAGFDVVFLSYGLSERFEADNENGLHWLRRFRQRPDFPPVIFMTGQGNELLVVEAMKSGAVDYIPKAELSHGLLISAVKDAVRGGRAADQGSSARDEQDASVFRIKGYRILQILSRRGHSSVYLAHSGDENRKVVLKVLRQFGDAQDGRSALERFMQEYEVISKIDHPNVVDIYAHGIADDHAYIAMEYFPRGDLKSRMRTRIPPQQALAWTEQIARALQVIHSVSVLHRDLKPANVMIREDETVALIDFGLAKELHLRSTLTETGEVFGTPYYMSPEQGHAEEVDERSDLYGLGVIFFELLTGKKPFTAQTPLAVIYKHSHAEIPCLPAHISAFQPMIDKLMAKDKRARYESAEALIYAIERFNTPAQARA